MNEQDFANLEVRVKKLEDTVFPPGGPGPNLLAKLAALDNRIQQVQAELKRDLRDLDARQTEKIRKAYEILAEVKNVVNAMANVSRGSLTLEA